LGDQADLTGVLVFYLGASMYYYVFYRSRLVPRWLSGWGLAGTTLGAFAGLLVLFRVTGYMSATQVVLNLPIGPDVGPAGRVICAIRTATGGDSGEKRRPASGGFTKRRPDRPPIVGALARLGYWQPPGRRRRAAVPDAVDLLGGTPGVNAVWSR